MVEYRGRMDRGVCHSFLEVLPSRVFFLQEAKKMVSHIVSSPAYLWKLDDLSFLWLVDS